MLNCLHTYKSKSLGFSPVTWQTEAEVSNVESQSGLHSKVQATLGYIARPHLKKKERKSVALFLYN